MVENPESCALNHQGYCMLTDRACTKVCRKSMKRYPPLGPREHLDLFLHYREQRRGQVYQWLAIAISVLALISATVANWKAFYELSLLRQTADFSQESVRTEVSVNGPEQRP